MLTVYQCLANTAILGPVTGHYEINYLLTLAENLAKHQAGFKIVMLLHAHFEKKIVRANN